MALAIRFEGLIQRGEVTAYADLARLGHVSRARLTQIMNLLNLAPDIQEALLFLPLVSQRREPVKEWMARPMLFAANVSGAGRRRCLFEFGGLCGEPIGPRQLTSARVVHVACGARSWGPTESTFCDRLYI